MSDIISRADAIDAVCGGCDHYYSCRVRELDRITECEQISALSALPSADAVSREEKENDEINICNNHSNYVDANYKPYIRLIDAEALKAKWYEINDIDETDRGARFVGYTEIARLIDQAPTVSANAEQGAWIPCSEKMPKELERVNVTWLNHNPPFYYQHIKDIPLTDTAVYYRGKWYWWDATVIDILAEYGEDCNAEQIDKDIEVVAWMPLPTPYKGGDDE